MEITEARNRHCLRSAISCVVTCHCSVDFTPWTPTGWLLCLALGQVCKQSRMPPTPYKCTPLVGNRESPARDFPAGTLKYRGGMPTVGSLLPCPISDIYVEESLSICSLQVGSRIPLQDFLTLCLQTSARKSPAEGLP